MDNVQKHNIYILCACHVPLFLSKQMALLLLENIENGSYKAYTGTHYLLISLSYVMCQKTIRGGGEFLTKQYVLENKKKPDHLAGWHRSNASEMPACS
jgi:hypothetical protein